MFARKGLGTLYKTATSCLPNAKFSIKKVLMGAMVYTQTYAIDALYLLKNTGIFVLSSMKTCVNYTVMSSLDSMTERRLSKERSSD